MAIRKPAEKLIKEQLAVMQVENAAAVFNVELQISRL